MSNSLWYDVRMGKQILGRPRQRPVAVAYGVFWSILLCLIAWVVWMTHINISGRLLEQNAEMLSKMYYALFGFPGVIAFICTWWKRDRWRAALTMRLILILVMVVVFFAAFTPFDQSMASYLGADVPEPGLVSAYEVLFIYILFVVGASFQCWLIASETRQKELTSVVGGVLVIMGILMPKLLESYSILVAYCSTGGCASDDRDGIALFEMAISCAAALAAMFVVGLFSESIIGFFRSSEEEVSGMSKGSLLDDSQNSEVVVSVSEVATVSDRQNAGVELAPVSSSAATCVLQEAADGGAIPAQATDTLTGACGSGGAVCKQLMGAAVSGLVAGACFSVVNRLLSRR